MTHSPIGITFHIVLHGISSSNTSHQGSKRIIRMKRRQKDCGPEVVKDFKQKAPSKYNRIGTNINRYHTLAVYRTHGKVQTRQIQALKRKQLTSARKGKISFIQLTGYWVHQQHSMAGPLATSSWSRENRLHINL